MDLMHTHEAGILFDRITSHGQEVVVEAVDRAIQGACEDFRDKEGYWPSKSNSEDWDFVEYRALDSLEIDHELVGM